MNIEENKFETLDSTIEALDTNDDDLDDNGDRNQNLDQTYKCVSQEGKSDFSMHPHADLYLITCVEV